MPLSFPPGVRLRARGEFRAVQQGGRRVTARYMTLVGRANTLGRDRLGIIATRRIGGAVLRNRARRILREVFRRQEPALAAARGLTPVDVVAVAKRELVGASLVQVEADFRSALRKLRPSKAGQWTEPTSN